MKINIENKNNKVIFLPHNYRIYIYIYIISMLKFVIRFQKQLTVKKLNTIKTVKSNMRI